MSAEPGVLVVVSSLCFGGAEKHSLALVNELDTSEFRLSLAVIKTDAVLLDQLKTERLHSLVSLNATRRIEWRAVRQLAERMKTLEIDVAICTNGYSAMYALFASWLIKRPIRIMEVFHTTLMTNFKDKLRMLAYGSVFRRCDVLVYVSELQRDYWRSRGLRAGREVVIQNGIDADHFTDRYTAAEKAAVRHEWGFTKQDYVLGICAALRPEKCHSDFLAALTRLRAAGLPAKGLIIGEGPERAHIEAQIQQSNLQSHVVITGFQADVRPLIASSDVMALTSRSIETFSLAILESMALGKPVVATRIGGAAEQIVPGMHGYLFEAGDVDALTEHLRCLAAPEERHRLGAAAAQRVRRQFTTRRMIAAYTAELRLLSRRRAVDVEFHTSPVQPE